MSHRIQEDYNSWRRLILDVMGDTDSLRMIYETIDLDPIF